MTFFIIAGYAPPCYDATTKKIKPVSISIALNERQFSEYLHELFAHLHETYQFFTVSHGGVYKEVNIRTPVDIKNLKYSGTLILTNKGEMPNSSSDTNHTNTNRTHSDLSHVTLCTTATAASSSMPQRTANSVRTSMIDGNIVSSVTSPSLVPLHIKPLLIPTFHQLMY